MAQTRIGECAEMTLGGIQLLAVSLMVAGDFHIKHAKSDSGYEVGLLYMVWYHAVNNPKSRAALDDVLAEIAYLD